MADTNYMTKEGYEKLRAELDEMKTRERSDIAQAIAEAREKGDLSENAEYHAAKEAQSLLELRINKLEKALAHVRIIDASQIDTSKVVVLSKVRIKNLQNQREMTYQLVSENEANLKEKKISVSSPIGQGLLGKKPGEIAEIKTPAGSVRFEIMDIGI